MKKYWKIFKYILIAEVLLGVIACAVLWWGFPYYGDLVEDVAEASFWLVVITLLVYAGIYVYLVIKKNAGKGLKEFYDEHLKLDD